MVRGSASRRSWADELEEEELAAATGRIGSPLPAASGLADATAHAGGSPPSWAAYGERLSFTDSEASDSEPVSPLRWARERQWWLMADVATVSVTAARPGTQSGSWMRHVELARRSQATRKPPGPSTSSMSDARAPLTRRAHPASRTRTDSTEFRAAAGADVLRRGAPSKFRPTWSASASTVAANNTSRRGVLLRRAASTAGANATDGGIARSHPLPAKQPRSDEDPWLRWPAAVVPRHGHGRRRVGGRQAPTTPFPLAPSPRVGPPLRHSVALPPRCRLCQTRAPLPPSRPWLRT